MNDPGRTPRRPIGRLSPDTVERIAAGEVVERPASVVKELVENAVDARASTVTVRLTNGGLSKIEVSDDGEGIPPDELDLAVERHATSKLAPEGPIERIGTLGFRGEALAAIATVSRLLLLSRPADRDGAQGIRVVGGRRTGRTKAPRSVGTTVEVAELFFNTPARRKFLRSPASEQLEVVRAVERQYLARPTVSLRLESEGREVATYPATGDLADAAARVLGVEFLHRSFGVAGEVPGGRVVGFLGRPPLAGASTGGLYLAINGRPVTSRPIQQAVRAAFGDSLPRARFPVGALHLDLAPERLDVNVHPTKREVRVADERAVAESLRRTIREALLTSPEVAEAPPGAGAPWGGPGSSVRPPVPGAAPVGAAPSAASRRPGEVRTQRRLDAGGTESRPVTAGGERRSPLVLLGCLDALYWVADSGDGLVLVDQHAASERLLYESLRSGRPLGRQTLVEPLTVVLTGAERAALAAHAEEVERSGFSVEPFGPETYRVRSVPSYRGRRVRAETVTVLLDELARGGRPTVAEGLQERTAATLACHAAIRAGDPVAAEEFARVLEALHALPGAPSTCPHGRPIMVGVPRSRLDRWFLRSGG